MRRGNRSGSKSNRGARSTKRPAYRRPRPHVKTMGANEPQSYPFSPDSAVTRKAIRYFAGRVSSNAAGQFLHRVSLRNPTRAIDGAGLYSDVVDISNCWDVYKPVRLRIEIVPVYPTATFSVGALVLAADYEDLDVSQVVNTVALANNYSEKKVLHLSFKSITEFDIPTLVSGSIPGLTSTAPAVIHEGGFLDFNAPPYDGVVYMVGEGYPANFAVFDLFLEMDILLKFAR
jgi:hypothetical protein